jgi:adenine-specific DNA-methyltransferase
MLNNKYDMTEFSDLSKELSSIITKQDKKEHGVFFTPKTYREAIIDSVKSNIVTNPKNILEPSFGSGEFIDDMVRIYPNTKITGVELDIKMYEKVKEKYKDNDNINLINYDFIEYDPDNKYDLIVGNPPYVVMKNGIPDEFQDITTGRPNLYCWFLYKCINLLEDHGILAFVIPNSILNTSYYDVLRQYIISKCEILNIIEFDKSKTKFFDTEQGTIGLVLMKYHSQDIYSSTKYIVARNNKTLFNVDYNYINKRLSTYPTLDKLGFRVKTGSIIWNQLKDFLTNDPKEGKLLIYNINIKNGSFKSFSETGYKNCKKQYIRTTKDLIRGPVILMNRGYGNTTYDPYLILIEDTINGDGFLVENHLNVIYPINDESKGLIKKVYEYLISDENHKYISSYTGNGAMSKTEIETMLPINIA